MSEAQVKNIITLVLAIVGPLLTVKGFATTDQVNQLGTGILQVVGPLLTLVSVGYGIFNHTPTNQIADTSKLKMVRRVVTDTNETALKVARPNVHSETTL